MIPSMNNVTKCTSVIKEELHIFRQLILIQGKFYFSRHRRTKLQLNTANYITVYYSPPEPETGSNTSSRPRVEGETDIYAEINLSEMISLNSNSS